MHRILILFLSAVIFTGNNAYAAETTVPETSGTYPRMAQEQPAAPDITATDEQPEATAAPVSQEQPQSPETPGTQDVTSPGTSTPAESPAETAVPGDEPVQPELSEQASPEITAPQNMHTPLKLPVPQNLSASSDNSGKIILKWQASEAECEYIIFRSDSSGSGTAEIAKTTGTTYEDSAIQPGNIYYYMIKASLNGTVSEFSNIASASISRAQASPVANAADNKSKLIDGLFWRSFVPGLGQYYQGRKKQAYIYGAAFTASAVAVCSLLYYRQKAWKDYSELPYGTPESDFDSKYNTYKYSTYSLWGASLIAASVYAMNRLDIYYFNKGQSSETKTGSNLSGNINIYSSYYSEINEQTYNISYSIKF